MKHTIVLFLLSLSLCSCARYTRDRDTMYTLDWKDEFNGKVLDTLIWTKMKRDPGARCLCNLTSDERMYIMRNGCLRLYARVNDGMLPGDTAKFLTGGITSDGKKTFTFGKIEVRARIHGAIGTWPAIWTLPQDRQYWGTANTMYTEIDLLEYVDRHDFVYQTAHNAYTLKDKRNWHHPEQQNLSPIKVGKFNTYSVEILPDMLIFAVNGKETLRYPRVEELQNQFHYGIESFLMIDMQIYPPKFWSSGIDAKTFPAYMDIDWVRVYKLKK